MHYIVYILYSAENIIMRKSRFSIAKPDIIEYFNNSEKKVYSKLELGDILYRERRFWRLTHSLTVDGFIELLIDGTQLKRHKLKFKPNTITRYSWGKVDILDLALGLNKNGYISHYTAVFYHGLTEQLPKTIYINTEQSKKEISNIELTQSQIDRALQKPVRLSNNFAVYRNNKIYILKGMYTDLLGVEFDEHRNYRVTNIERTLIDIAVRPDYAGGIWEVIKIYENAAQSVSVNKLVSYLKRLEFIYPYHQCIGFYMMKSGKYRANQIQLIRKIEMPYKFYLTHGIEDKKFSKEMNLYYPSNITF